MKTILIVQNCAVESAGTFLEYLREQRIRFRVIHSYRHDPFPPVTDCRAVISLGSPLSVNESSQHPHLQSLHGFTAEVVRRDIPYLGICFGAQMLARVLGAVVRANEAKEIGVSSVHLTSEGLSDPLFDGLPPDLPVFQWHGETFKLPFGSILLAKSDVCPHQAFRRGKAVGVQFHVEAASSELSAWCKAYESELKAEQISGNSLIEEYNELKEQFREISFRLMRNFLSETE